MTDKQKAEFKRDQVEQFHDFIRMAAWGMAERLFKAGFSWEEATETSLETIWDSGESLSSRNFDIGEFRDKLLEDFDQRWTELDVDQADFAERAAELDSEITEQLLRTGLELDEAQELIIDTLRG